MSVTHKLKPLKFTYEMNDTPLTEVEHYPYLGVEIYIQRPHLVPPYTEEMQIQG